MDRVLIFFAGAGVGAVAGRLLNRHPLPFPAPRTDGKAGADTRESLARTQLLLKEIRSLVLHADVPDEVLERKIKARVARNTRHPDLINVQVVDGVVVLRGHAATEEAFDLVESLSRLRGVKNVEDRLEESPRQDGFGYRSARQNALAEFLTGAQGKHAGYPIFSPLTAVLTAIGGLSLAAAGFRRGGSSGGMLVAGGAALLGAGIGALLPGRREGIFKETGMNRNAAGTPARTERQGSANGKHGIQDQG
jgi:hypothetical protein